ncbi:condensation domain-containing protein, partial [Myxococcus sp. RHSTA-1-4]|uniref:condensation domain-containing protein n=1 Tax=Myxococcus sp. RHSTA-1-4 TaxID=2874601 RepID=UPI001CBCF3FA
MIRQSPTQWSTLVELLEARASAQPAARLYSFVEDFEGEESELNRGALQHRARLIGGALQSLGARGERAVLLYPPGLEYISGFFGCLYAGAIAVPAYPPDPTRLERTLPRLLAIIKDAQASVVLTTSWLLSMAEMLFEQAPELKSLRWVATDTLEEDAASVWRAPDVSADSLAFLQYTSGSTGTPKGVMLSHGNLLHNLGLISHAFQADADSVGTIWLPPYHDMGLIGGILQPLYGGFPVALMSPLTFLKRPLLWLQTLSRHKATISGGPNFAYDLCVRKVTPEEREGLDLSSWRVAFSGAEPIRPETLDRFVEAFGPQGFRRESFYPCYGLAEGTLIVSGGLPSEAPILRTLDSAALEQNRAVEPGGDVATRTLVSCGRNLPDQEVLIVHPETREILADGQVGEVWVRGPSVALGYWRRTEETEHAFHARPVGGGEHRYLRTGDLGFFQQGELFVTGRLKDLIILRGRNHYPQDLELTADQSHPAIRPGCSAAFALEVEGEERLAVVLEVDPRRMADPAEVIGALRQRLAETHEVQPHTLVLIEPGALPKTSSGKVQRRACRQALLDGRLAVVSSWSESSPGSTSSEQAPSTSVSATPIVEEERVSWLRARLAPRLHVRPEELDATAPLTRYGLDSLAAVELAHFFEKELGVSVPMQTLLAGCTLEELARALPAEPRREQALEVSTGPGPFPLSPAQERLWFLEQLTPGSAVYHLPVGLRLDGRLDVAALQASLHALVQRHESLRTVFHSDEGAPSQSILLAGRTRLEREDLSGLPEAQREAEALRRARDEARRPFDLARGPVLRALLLRLGEERHVLVLTVHHLVSDGTSMGVLARELAALYAAHASGREAHLPPAPARYVDHAAAQRARLERGELDGQLEYWKHLHGAPPLLELPTDAPRPALESHRGARHAFQLDAGLWSQVQALARREGTTPFSVLLTAYQVLLSRLSGQTDVCVGTPVAGRGRAGQADVIGLFVNTLAFRAEMSGAPSFLGLLSQVRERVLGALAHQDVPFERVVEAVQPVRSQSHAPLFQAMLVLQDDPALALELEGLRWERLDVDTGASMFDLTLFLFEGREGALDASFEYATDLFGASTVARVAGHFRTLLHAAVTTPERSIAELPLLTREEREQLLVTWNDTRLPEASERNIPQVIEAQV